MTRCRSQRRWRLGILMTCWILGWYKSRQKTLRDLHDLCKNAYMSWLRVFVLGVYYSNTQRSQPPHCWGPFLSAVSLVKLGRKCRRCFSDSTKGNSVVMVLSLTNRQIASKLSQFYDRLENAWYCTNLLQLICVDMTVKGEWRTGLAVDFLKPKSTI